MNTVIIGNDLQTFDTRTLFPDVPPGYSARDALMVQRIIIHHDAVPFDSLDQPAEMLRIQASYAHHLAQGWQGIAYNLYVFPSGRVYYVGEWATVRYHTRGPDDPLTPQVVSAHNEQGFAIAIAGNYSISPPTPYTLRTTRAAVANVQFMFSRFLPVSGHQQHSGTSCPGATWPSWSDAVTVLPPTLNRQ